MSVLLAVFQCSGFGSLGTEWTVSISKIKNGMRHLGGPCGMSYVLPSSHEYRHT